jgi:hypothetical protein
MGCWNKTCGLSNMHIHAGEKVYTFILERTSGSVGDSHCYSTHLYTPILIPFYSEYDDYGSGENNHGIGLNVIIESIRNKLIEQEVGENKYHDIAVKKDTFDETALFESIRESRLYVKNYWERYDKIPGTQIDMLMMKKCVVDNILTNHKIEKYKSGNYVYHTFGDVVQEIDTVIEKVKKDIEDTNNKIAHYHKVDSDTESVLSLKDTYFGLLRNKYYLRGIGEKNEMKIGDYLWYADEHHFSTIVPIVETFFDFMMNDQIKEAKEFLIDFLKGCFIAQFMEHTRHSWIPQGGEGSQNVELDGHKLLAQTVLKIAEQEEKEREEW